MRSGFYQNISGNALEFWKKRRLLWGLAVWVVMLFVGVEVRGQAPDLFSFQGVARDELGKIIANKDIQIEVRIVTEGSDQLYFQEPHSVKTNASGIFNINIGSVNVDPDYFLSKIDWSARKYFLEIYLNPGDGIFVNLGKTQLLSVPYALYSDKAGAVRKWDDNLPVIQNGTQDSPVLPTVGIGSKLIWYPRKAAFRSGLVNGNQWEDAQIGNNSFASGLDVIASGAQSIALGNGTTANALNGIVLGKYNDIPDSDLFGTPQGRLLQIGNGGPGNRSNALTILNSGKVGIGGNVLVPAYLLDIGGRVRIKHNGETAGIHLNTSTNTLGSFIGMKADDQVGFFMGSNWWFWVNSQGDGFLKGNIIQTSDRRLKRDFSRVSNSLSKLTNLTGQHYFWKDTAKSQALQTGLIAQEVEQYFPELVTTDEKGFKAVNYIGLIPHLIESVKTLKAQTEVIGALEKKLESFTARETQMRDEVASVIRDLRSELSNIKAANNSNQQSK